MSRHFPTFAIPNPPPGSFPQCLHFFYLRRAVFGIAFIIIYGLLDRTTVYLQIWPSISAWYPPVGLSVRVICGLGPSILPVIVVAGYLAGYLNYHQNVSSLPFLLTNPLLPVIYGTASLYLRRKLTGKYRIRSTSDCNRPFGCIPDCRPCRCRRRNGVLVLEWRTLRWQLCAGRVQLVDR